MRRQAFPRLGVAGPTAGRLAPEAPVSLRVEALQATDITAANQVEVALSGDQLMDTVYNHPLATGDAAPARLALFGSVRRAPEGDIGIRAESGRSTALPRRDRFRPVADIECDGCTVVEVRGPRLRYFAGIWACLFAAALPYGYIWLMSVGARSAQEMLPWLAFSLLASAIGIALTVLCWRRLRVIAALLAIPFALPVGCSLLLGQEGLHQKAFSDDISFCGMERKRGATPIPRNDERYRKRLYIDGDGFACEESSNVYRYGRE